MSATQAKTLSSTVEFSTFMMGDALFGIDILHIQEINRQYEMTPVPQAETCIKGILNLRGRIVTVMDLGLRLGLKPVKRSGNNRNIIVNSGGEYIGLMVDRIGDVHTADERELDPPPSNVNGAGGRYFKGVLKTGDALIGILDLDEVVGH